MLEHKEPTALVKGPEVSIVMSTATWDGTISFSPVCSRLLSLGCLKDIYRKTKDSPAEEVFLVRCFYPYMNPGFINL